MLNVLCVWNGEKYGFEYVERLHNMVARHMPTPVHFFCLTDHKVPPCFRADGFSFIKSEWPAWWAKMQLFDVRAPWRSDRCLYFDLDTVICNDLTPLAEFAGGFGICRNFTAARGLNSSGCNLGSCVMSIAPAWGMRIYPEFVADCGGIMEACRVTGDQMAIERLTAHRTVTLLQDVMPPTFFLGYRDVTAVKPAGASVVVFAGAHKPHNSQFAWIKDEWQ